MAFDTRSAHFVSFVYFMKTAVVIPCYRVKDHILAVLGQIGTNVSNIYVVDDCCPEKSGAFVQAEIKDKRVTVLFHETNLGVGGAVLTGYRRAADDGCDVVVKIDGDGQMDSRLIDLFVKPIEMGIADYTKGNRFFSPRFLESMPLVRKLGNASLSFISKASTGYWNVMDPTNGFTAIHTNLLRLLDLDRIDRRYFFESDLLFRLNTIRAVVRDVPMEAVYNDEVSGVKETRAIWEFGIKHMRNLFKRLAYKYFVRDFNTATIQVLFGLPLVCFGILFGAYHWRLSVETHNPATTGTVMVATLPIILGFQLLLSAFSFDVQSVPTECLHPFLTRDNK